MSEANTTWLPNLVGGVSIWKLGVDLNEPKFMDGRLLVPETEGSESLPARVAWNLDGLVPLVEARQKWPAEVTAAVADFKAGLERVGKVFATPNSGFDKFKEAFTVPSLEADGGTHYFYAPEAKKLFVTNWGASPRSITGRADYVFGYEDWGRAFGGAAAATTGAAPLGAAVAAAANTSTAPEADKEDKKKAESKPRPWWIWPLFALVAIALVLLALLLLRTCDDTTSGGPDAADVLVEGATDAARLGPDGAPLEDAAGTDPRAEAGADAGDASLDGAASDGGDGGSKDGGAKDGGKDGGKDGAVDDDDDDDGDGDSSGGSSGGAGNGSGTAKVIVTTGPGGGGKTSVHRRHYQGEAVKWRVSTGGERVSRTEQRGHRYDVWLTPGKTFEGVRVEWQDKAGKWHPH